MRGDSARTGAGAPPSSALWPAASTSTALRAISKLEGLYALIPPAPKKCLLSYRILESGPVKSRYGERLSFPGVHWEAELCVARVAADATQITVCLLKGLQ